MPSVNDLKSSKFLTKNDVEPPKLVTIDSYTKINVAMESKAPESKWTLMFRELDKPLVLNSTNGQLIAQIIHTVYGVTRDDSLDEDGETMCPANEQFRNWVGKKVVLYNDPTVSYGNEITGGIRVRATRIQQPQLTKEEQLAGELAEPEDNVDDEPSATEDESIPF